MKKIISLFLSVAILLSITAGIDLSAFADTYSGSCGDNVYWNFDTDSGTLTISGTGDMYDYNNYYGALSPWYQNSDITTAVISDGVTSVGNYAFYNCYSLAEISIPNSVTSIGDSAFRYCRSLTSVIIPDSVTSIGDSVFRYCFSLTSVTISYSVTRIGNYAFSGCGIKEIKIPDSVTRIGDSAFSGCNKLKEITMPDGVTSIGDSAFYSCRNLTKVNIPEGVTRIGDSAFCNCSSLAEITISDSVTSIGDYAFSGCGKLREITIPDSVTSIGDYAFDGCSNLSSINVNAQNENYSSVDGVLFNKDKTMLIKYPAGNNDMFYSIPDGVTSIGIFAFSDCSNLASATIPNSVTSIGDNSFYGCTSLESITIPDSVTSIEDGAFGNCSSLASITIPDSVVNIGDNAFQFCSSLISITIPNNVTSIGYDAFYNCSGLTSVKISDSVKSLDGVFSGCSSLRNVTIPDSVTSIENAFSSCSSLATITIPDSVTVIDGAFNGCSSLTSIKIPDGVTSIGWYTFDSCNNLTSITIPDSVTSIGGCAFRDCTRLTSVIIPDGVTSIGIFAFSGCSSLTCITIPDGITSIDTGIFKNCSSLSSITIPDNITNIDPEVFENCSSLTSIIIPDSITRICDRAFQQCYSLTDIYYIGTEEEWNNIIVGEYNDDLLNATIHYNSTAHEHSYTAVVTPPTCTKKGYTTYTCSCGDSYIDDYVPATGHDYVNGVCADCGEIDSSYYFAYTVLEDGTAQITDYTGSETELVIPSEIDGYTVTSIGERTLYDCASLTSVTIPSSIIDIGYQAFGHCMNLTDISVEDGNEKYCAVDGVLFSKDKKTIISYPAGKTQTEYSIPESVENISSYAFRDNAYLESVTIPESVTEIGKKAFDQCTSLTEIYYSGSEMGWNKITVGDDNSALDFATIYFAKESLLEVEDRESGVTVAENALEVLPGNTELVVEKVSETTTGVSYNIGLQKDGEEIQPNGTVTVKIPVPETMDGNACKVYRQESDGSYTDMNAVYQDRYMIFTADHFSRYILTTGDPSDMQVMLGDVDGDGELTDWDAIVLNRYLAGWEVEINSAAADTDGDNELTDWDAIVLERNLAGWDIELKS